MDQHTTIRNLKDKVQKFCEDRDWDQYHGAKDPIPKSKGSSKKYSKLEKQGRQLK